MNFQELCNFALTHWGLDAQLDCMVEECGEFIAARNHWRRGRTGYTPMLEEIADVAVFCDEMELYFPEIKAIKEQKIQRLIDKIQANLPAKEEAQNL